MSIGDLPESLSQAMLVRIMLVRRLGVPCKLIPKVRELQGAAGVSEYRLSSTVRRSERDKRDKLWFLIFRSSSNSARVVVGFPPKKKKKGQMGSALMGSLQLICFLTEGLFGYSQKCQGVHFSSICQKSLLLQQPHSGWPQLSATKASCAGARPRRRRGRARRHGDAPRGAQAESYKPNQTNEW